MTAYKSKNFTRVLTIIKDLPLTTDVLLLQAISYKEINQLDKAKQSYLKVIATQQGQLDIARWGFVEVCFKQGDFNTAKNNLQFLAARATNNSFQYGSAGQKAMDILQLL